MDRMGPLTLGLFLSVAGITLKLFYMFNLKKDKKQVFF
jgi:hypothetical protein